jgi:exportin-T
LVRKRVFYLFFRFVQSLRIDIDIQHVPSILQAIQDLLTFDTELPPDMELPESSSDAIDQEFLANVLKELSTFDAQLYMFEAAGALISTLWSLPEHQSNALQSVTGPLLSRLSACLQVPIPAPGVQMGEDDFKNVLAVHHCIQALGCIPKGFPEYPSPVPPNYVPPPLAEFRQMADAILVSLDITGRFRIVREAVSLSILMASRYLLSYRFTGTFLFRADYFCCRPFYYGVHPTTDELAPRSL